MHLKKLSTLIAALFSYLYISALISGALMTWVAHSAVQFLADFISRDGLGSKKQVVALKCTETDPVNPG